MIFLELTEVVSLPKLAIKHWINNIDETSALENLLRTTRTNPFTAIDIFRNELIVAVPHVAKINQQIDDINSQIAGKDFSSLKRYEELEQQLNKTKVEIENLESVIREKERKIQRFDIQIQEEPDPKYEALCRLVKYFEEAADALLKAKKQRLEELMRNDLNINLAAYRGMCPTQAFYHYRRSTLHA